MIKRHALANRYLLHFQQYLFYCGHVIARFLIQPISVIIIVLCLFPLAALSAQKTISNQTFDLTASDVELIKDNNLLLALNKIMLYQDILEQLSVIQRIHYYKLLAEIYVDQAKYQQSKTVATIGLELSKKLLSPSILITELFYARGFSLESLGNFEQASQDYLSGLEVAESLHQNIYIAYGLVNLGAVYYQTDRLERSLVILNEAKKIADKTIDDELKGFVSSELGILHSYLLQDDKALFYYQQSYQYYQKTGKDLLAQNSLINIAINYSRNEHYQKAIEIYLTLIANNQDKRHTELIYSIYAGIAWAYFKKSSSDVELAYKYLTLAEHYLSKVEQHDLKLQHFIDKAFMLVSLQQFDEALVSLGEAKKWLEKEELTVLSVQSSIDILNLRGKILYLTGKFEQAYNIKSDELSLSITQYENEKVDAIEEARIKLEAEQADVYTAILRNEQKVRRITLNKIAQENKQQQTYLTIVALVVLLVLWLIIRLILDKRKITSMVNTDALTSIYNRGFVLQQASKAFAKTVTKHHDFSIIMIKVDHFKHVNEQYGYATGDIILKKVAKYGQSVVTKKDIFGRYSGDEFIMFLPNTSLIHALTIAQNLRDLVRNHCWDFSADCNATLSIGVASAIEKDADELSLLLKCTDDLVYQAVQQGQDKVCG